MQNKYINIGRSILTIDSKDYVFFYNWVTCVATIWGMSVEYQ